MNYDVGLNPNQCSKNSNEPCTFLFLGRSGRFGCTEISSLLLQCSTFEGFYFYVFMNKMNEKIDFLYLVCSIRTKKLHNIKVRKIAIFALKHTFLGQNRLRNRIEAARAQYLPLLWPVPQLGAVVEPNDVILTNLMTSHCFNPIP